MRRGSVAFEVGGKRVVVRSRKGRFLVPAGAGERVAVARGAARDRYGNRNVKPLVLGG